MGAPGWDDAPLVDIRAGRKPKPVTLIWPYYDNPQTLAEQLERLAALPHSVRDYLSVIVVDDGSPTHPAEAVFKGSQFLFGEAPPARLFRIKVDIRWNWLAARNIAMRHAAEGWAALTDIDHSWPLMTLAGLVAGAHDEACIYRFRRYEFKTGVEIHSHPNTFFIHKTTFWKVGGYDEALSGFYGTDGDWRRRCAASAKILTLKDYVERNEHNGDSSTTRYKRKQPEDAGKKAIIRKRGKGWRPRVLSFPYVEVQL